LVIVDDFVCGHRVRALGFSCRNRAAKRNITGAIKPKLSHCVSPQIGGWVSLNLALVTAQSRTVTHHVNEITP